MEYSSNESSSDDSTKTDNSLFVSKNDKVDNKLFLLNRIDEIESVTYEHVIYGNDILIGTKCDVYSIVKQKLNMKQLFLIFNHW